VIRGICNDYCYSLVLTSLNGLEFDMVHPSATVELVEYSNQSWIFYDGLRLLGVDVCQ
jgi:hypothetical protein